MKIDIPLVLVFWALVSGCSSHVDLDSIADDAVKKQAIGYIDQLIQGGHESLVSILAPETLKGNEAKLFAEMAETFPDEIPITTELVGYRSWRDRQGSERYDLAFQYGYENTWIIVSVAFQNLESGASEIFGFTVYPSVQSLQNLNQFRLTGLGFAQIFFLGGCSLVPLFIVYTLIVCIRMPMRTGKAMWIFFIAIGITRFSINWTTGQFGVSLLSLQLFGAGAVTSSIYAPWFLSFSLPLGAILFWVKRDSLRLEKGKPEDGSIHLQEQRDKTEPN